MDADLRLSYRERYRALREYARLYKRMALDYRSKALRVRREFEETRDEPSKRASVPIDG